MGEQCGSILTVISDSFFRIPLLFLVVLRQGSFGIFRKTRIDLQNFLVAIWHAPISPYFTNRSLFQPSIPSEIHNMDAISETNCSQLTILEICQNGNRLSYPCTDVLYSIPPDSKGIAKNLSRCTSISSAID